MSKGLVASLFSIIILSSSAFACSGGTKVSNPTTSPVVNYPCESIPEDSIQIEYRDTNVNIKTFERLENCDRTVRAGWWDPQEKYFVINLDGSNYHYCLFFNGDWLDLQDSEHPYEHYKSEIKGNFDCRDNYGEYIPRYTSENATEQMEAEEITKPLEAGTQVTPQETVEVIDTVNTEAELEIILTDTYSWGTASASKTKILQESLGLTPDGSYGTMTLQAHLTALNQRNLSVANLPEKPPTPTPTPIPTPAPTPTPDPCHIINRFGAGFDSGWSYSNTNPLAGTSITLTFNYQSNYVPFFVQSDGCSPLGRVTTNIIYGIYDRVYLYHCDDYHHGNSENCNERIGSENESAPVRVSGDPYDGVYQITINIPSDIRDQATFLQWNLGYLYPSGGYSNTVHIPGSFTVSNPE